jgi:hypothetical protein
MRVAESNFCTAKSRRSLQRNKTLVINTLDQGSAVATAGESVQSIESGIGLLRGFNAGASVVARLCRHAHANTSC